LREAKQLPVAKGREPIHSFPWKVTALTCSRTALNFLALLDVHATAAGAARRSLLQLLWIESFLPHRPSLEAKLMVRQQQEALGHLGG